MLAGRVPGVPTAACVQLRLLVGYINECQNLCNGKVLQVSCCLPQLGGGCLRSSSSSAPSRSEHQVRPPVPWLTEGISAAMASAIRGLFSCAAGVTAAL